MENGNAGKATLRDAILYFADYGHCHEFMVSLRWPDGKVRCPECGSEKVCYLGKNRVWKCYATHLKPRFTLKTGTIFEDSPIGLEKWLPAVWMLLNDKNGISSWELHRALGVTQKTAWFMLHRIRLAMQDQTFNKLGGPGGGEVEVDETFVGGKVKNMHRSKKRRVQAEHGQKGAKAVVMGMLERGGTVRTTILDDARNAPCSRLSARTLNRDRLFAPTNSVLSGRWTAGTLMDSSITWKPTSTAMSTRTAWRTSGAC